MRPTTIILGKNSNKPWDKWDILLAKAYQIMEAERCGQCGLPRWICYNDDSDILFDIEEDTCFAKRELDSLADGRGPDYKAPFGNQERPVPKRYSGGKFDAEVREAFYLAENKKREAS